MAWQVFGSLAAGNQPLSLFDTLTAQIGQTVICPCTATGTNAITLSPIASNAPPLTSYNNFQQFSFVAQNTSTGAVTLQFSSLASLPVYKPGNIAAGSGDITSGVLYVIAYNLALNAGAGGFVIVSATPSTLSLPVTVANGGTGLTSLTTYAPLCGGTGTTANIQQATTGFSTAGNVLTSQGAAAVPQWLVPAASAGLVSIVTYGSSQTITIPAGATKAWIWLCGAGGGCSTTGVNPVAGTGGGSLIKYLSSLTAGNTLALTIGAAGANNSTNGTAGGTTTLASGTQSITTLTCGGGSNSALANNPGGTATNGDLNFPAFSAQAAFFGCPPASASIGVPLCGFGFAGVGTPGYFVSSSVVATAGFCMIGWFV